MPITSWGYRGTIDETQWSQMSEFFGCEYAVRSPAEWKPTAVANERQVSIAPGIGYGKGVADLNTEAASVAIPAPTTSAGRWALVCARRTWGGDGHTEFVMLLGDTTDTTTPTAPPLAYPADRLVGAGLVDDQPICWAWVRTSSTAVVIFDLRTYPLSTTLEVYSYRWGTDAARLAETGMREGDTGYQIDGGTLWKYISGVWVVWERRFRNFTPQVTNFSIGNGEMFGRYSVYAGVNVNIEMGFRAGSTTVMGTEPIFSAPFMVRQGPRTSPIGNAQLVDNSNGALIPALVLQIGGQMSVRVIRADELYSTVLPLQANRPFVWEALDSMDMSAATSLPSFLTE